MSATRRDNGLNIEHRNFLSRPAHPQSPSGIPTASRSRINLVFERTSRSAGQSAGSFKAFVERSTSVPHLYGHARGARATKYPHDVPNKSRAVAPSNKEDASDGIKFRVVRALGLAAAARDARIRAIRLQQVSAHVGHAGTHEEHSQNLQMAQVSTNVHSSSSFSFSFSHFPSVRTPRREISEAFFPFFEFGQSATSMTASPLVAFQSFLVSFEVCSDVIPCAIRQHRYVKLLLVLLPSASQLSQF